MDAWLDRLRKEIEEATMNLRESDWTRAPEGRWNAAQIMEHLGRTYGTTAKMLELGMGVGGPPQVRAAKIAERLKRILVVNLGIFPHGIQAPAMVVPKGDAGPGALDRTFSNLARMDMAITTAEKRWGSARPIALHLVLGPLNSSQWRKFHYVHGHHHLVEMQKRLALG